jgi:hypothetical protein
MLSLIEYIVDGDFDDLIHEHEFMEFFDKYYMEFNLEESKPSVKFTSQPWDDEGDLDDIYAQILKHVDANKAEFLRKAKFVARKARNAKVYVGEFNVKSLKSFKDKVSNRDKKASQLTDVMRTSISVESAEDVEAVSKMILKTFVVVNKKGGLVDAKTKGKDKDFGYYGANHFLVNMNGLVSEIIVMTKRLSSMKDEAHKFYDEHRDAVDYAKKHGTELTPDVLKDMDRSKRMFAQGNRSNKFYNRGK